MSWTVGCLDGGMLGRWDELDSGMSWNFSCPDKSYEHIKKHKVINVRKDIHKQSVKWITNILMS